MRNYWITTIKSMQYNSFNDYFRQYEADSMTYGIIVYHQAPMRNSRVRGLLDLEMKGVWSWPLKLAVAPMDC